MEIHIVTPTQDVVQGEAEEVYAYGPKGEFGVLSGHAHFLTPLTAGRLYFEKLGQKQTFMVTGGFLEVFDEKVYVLADEVENADTINLPESQKRLEELEKKLGQESMEPREWEALQAERDKEMARILTVS